MEQRQRVKVERGHKRVRAYLGGEVIADTRNPLLVWEVPYYPMYYFPLDDVHLERLTQTDETTHAPSRGDARLFDVRGGRGVVRERAAARYDDTPVDELRGTQTQRGPHGRVERLERAIGHAAEEVVECPLTPDRPVDETGGECPVARGERRRPQHHREHEVRVRTLLDAYERVDRERRHRADRPHFVVQFR